MLWWGNQSLRLGLVCTCGFVPPSLIGLGQEAPFILYSTSAKQRGAQARNKDAGGGPCRGYYGKKRLVFVFFFNGKICITLKKNLKVCN